MTKTNQNPYTQFASVDLVKYIMAFAVVAIHFRPNYSNQFQYPELLEWFIRLAVPFYFIASGYLVERKLKNLNTIHEHKEYLKFRVKKLARLWICWIIISLPLALAAFGLLTGNGFHNIIPSIKTYIWMLVIGGWAVHAAPLWFIYSMIWVTIILYCTLAIRNYKQWLLSIFLILNLVYWTADNFDIVALKIFKTYTYNILGGGIYIILGMLLCGKKINSYIILLLLIASFALTHFKLPFNTVVGGGRVVCLSIIFTH